MKKNINSNADLLIANSPGLSIQSPGKINDSGEIHIDVDKGISDFERVESL